MTLCSVLLCLLTNALPGRNVAWRTKQRPAKVARSAPIFEQWLQRLPKLRFFGGGLNNIARFWFEYWNMSLFAILCRKQRFMPCNLEKRQVLLNYNK
jgi:hypothetical protein